MDPLNVVDLTRTLVDIDSTTGRETEVIERLERLLRAWEWDVDVQPVSDGRSNLVARRAQPAVVLTTHVDCVPPFFPSRLEGDLLFGRGACDAKGALAAQIAAAETLHRDGEDRVGLLFVVGEERGSDGAAVAGALGGPGSAFLVNGEPTDNRLGLATRGALRVVMRASGRAAHSAYPELGESAVEKLIEALHRLRALPLPEDPTLGRTFYNVGVVNGGVAPNVTAPSATAETLFRTVGDGRDVLAALAPLDALVETTVVLEIPPVRLRTIEGWDAAVFPFTTDIPLLRGWGEPLLLGPGSIHVAHTDEEHVRVSDLTRAVADYARLAATLLDQLEAQRVDGGRGPVSGGERAARR
jgi:acetylornithine deacetylase